MTQSEVNRPCIYNTFLAKKFLLEVFFLKSVTEKGLRMIFSNLFYFYFPASKVGIEVSSVFV